MNTYRDFWLNQSSYFYSVICERNEFSIFTYEIFVFQDFKNQDLALVCYDSSFFGVVLWLCSCIPFFGRGHPRASNLVSWFFRVL